MKKIFLVVLLCILLTFIGCSDKVQIDEFYEDVMADGKIVVLVDAGHGLGDPGAMNDENLGDVTEADINFAVATYLASELEERGYTVIMSHDGIVKPHTEYDDELESYGPGERADYSNSTDADIFVSIHCDSYPDNVDVYGTRVYYAVDKQYDTKYDATLTKAIAQKVDSAFESDKDVVVRKMVGQDSYTVLYKTAVPAVLVECGFITNKGDAEKLIDTDWQMKFAKSLADGIESCFEK